MSWVFAGLHIFIIVLKLRKLELPFNQPRGGFLCGSAGKESSCNAGNLGSIPGLGRSPGEGKGYQNTPVFWPREFHGLYAKNWTRLSDFHFTLTKLRKEANRARGRRAESGSKGSRRTDRPVPSGCSRCLHCLPPCCTTPLQLA